VVDLLELFLDTNIWLSFYNYSRDDLEELRKLAVLIDNERVKLYVTDQVRYEFRRNREGKFADAMKRFNAEGLNDQFPQMCKEYDPDYKAMREAIRGFRDAKKRLLAKVNEDFEKEALKADEIIKILFSKAVKINASDEIIRKAEVRNLRGNPPGKKDSIGDAINWECLGAVPK